MTRVLDVRIDELVLEGVPAPGRERLVADIERELAAILTGTAAPPAGNESLAMQIARAIHAEYTR